MKQDRIKAVSDNKLLGNIAELRFLLHLTSFIGSFILFTAFSNLCFSQPVSRQIIDSDVFGKPPLIFPLSKYPKFNVVSEDIEDTIKSFKTDNPSKQIKKFKKGLEKTRIDENLRKEIIAEVYKLAKRNIIENKELESQIRKFFSPILKLYNKQDTYKFIILKHPTPYISTNNP